MLEAGWQDSIREKNRLGEPEKAERDLRKIRMAFYDKLDSTDKFFVSYCLAYHVRESNKELAREHLLDISEIFKIEDPKDYQVEYHKYLWLNVNINCESMNIVDILKDMNDVYCFYKKNGNVEVTMSALGTISVFTKDEGSVLYALETMLQAPITDYNFISSVLNDCEKINHDLYIKGLKIIEKYNIKREIN